MIREIRANTKGLIEIEVFIHGAVCFSYSGRCAISDYLTGFRANRGECKHPCRWKYALVEEQRPGEYMPVFEDERGLYLFNSKDLALFEYVPVLKDIGVDSFKIEGRMKSVHYIATVVSFYRQALDGREYGLNEGMALLNRVHNRRYSTGFIKGFIDDDDYMRSQSTSSSETTFVGNVIEDMVDGRSVLEIRNKINAGETLETLSPDGSLSTITLPSPLITADRQQVDFANNSQFILLDRKLEPYSILRRL
jgi:putative protease